jgi:hypothetical protein
MTTLLSILSSQRDPVSDLDRWAASQRAHGPAVWRFATFTSSDVAAAVAAALDRPAGDLVAEAWGQYQEVERARRDTRRHPGRSTTVRLGPHTIRSTEDIKVDLERNGAHRTLVTLRLDVQIAVNAANLTVAAGEVSEVAPGEASATATLSIRDVPLVRGSVAGIDLAGTGVSTRDPQIGPPATTAGHFRGRGI